MNLTEGQIKAQVRSIRRTTRKPMVAVALRCSTPWNGPSRLMIDNQPHQVAWCRSDLEVRALLHAAAAARESSIALCPFDSGQLGDDVLARLAKRRVHPPHTGDILSSLFQAASVDPRILANAALANALIETAPSDGYPPVPGGVLDLQTAWLSAIERLLGRRDVAISVAALLEASLDPAFRCRLEGMAPDLRRQFFDWAASGIDPVVAWMSPIVEAGRTADLIPLGLLLALLFQSSAAPQNDLATARVRLEGWFGGRSIPEGVARSWGQAAHGNLGPLQKREAVAPVLNALLGRLDALIVEFKVPQCAFLSHHSPSGFEQRMKGVASLLQRLSAPGSAEEKRKALVAAIGDLHAHVLAHSQQRRIERCEMAARLARWLSSGGKLSEGSALASIVEGYVRTGGFVDWARSLVQEGGDDAELSKAFDTLLKRVDEASGAFEAAFATQFADWCSHGTPSSMVFVPIEDALERWVGPVAGQSPVLLLVMDGMSMAVFRELLEDLVQRGNWLECRPNLIPPPAALLATVPSITEISRRALFRGRLHPESTPTEQSAFGSNDRLFSLSGGQTRPVLFLKGDLQRRGESGLSEEVKHALGNRKCRIVGAVLNAVDDHLSGSDQIAPRWSLDFIRPLRELLQLAAEAGRAVLLTSDHGHVLEHRTVLKAGASGAGDRHRFEGGPAGEGELRFSGDRIQRAIGRAEVIAAYERNVRYAVRQRGYHGGASPQEIIIPLVLLRHLGKPIPDGWTDVAPSPFWPEWWQLTASTTAAAPVTAPEKPSAMTAGLDLFAHAEAKGRGDGWIEPLLDSEIYAEQCRLAVRGAPDRRQVCVFLEALSSRGGTMPREALAERLGLPLLRLSGHVQNLARIFNVDGYEVLTLDTASGTVVLNVKLLQKQFGVTEANS